MPPLKQPKTLVYLSQTAFSSWYSVKSYQHPIFYIGKKNAIKFKNPQLVIVMAFLPTDLFENLPQNVAEELSYYVLQAAFGVINHYCMQCDPELDDQVLVQENCQYLNGILKVIHKRVNICCTLLTTQPSFVTHC